MLNPRLKDIFLDLIRIEGISHFEKNVADYIRKFCSRKGVKVQIDDSANDTQCNTGNIIVTIGTGGDTVLLSHMDTARSTKGVKAIFKHDRITSDGSTVLGVDNRVGVAILLYLIELVSDRKITTKDFTIAFTTCEETTLAGSKFLGINGNIKNGFVFDSYLNTGYFVNQSFGAANFSAIFRGKSAHAGIAPEKGINALEPAIQSTQKISLGRTNENTTINIGKFICDSPTNVIPDLVTVSGEVRSISRKEVEESLEQIKDVFINTSENFGTQVEFSSNWVFKPYYVDDSYDVYKRIWSSINKVGISPVTSKSWGGSDANSLNARNIPTVNIGIGAQNPHSNDEYILYNDFQKSSEIATELVKEI